MTNNIYNDLSTYIKDDTLLKGGKYLKEDVKYNKDLPLVTIITVCRNAEKTIQKTIDSVINQTYKNIEYILIDGESTDNTINIIKKNEAYISFWLSQKDESATEGINKGFKIAKGDYIFLLNADDFVNSDFIKIAVETFDNNSAFVFWDMFIGKPYNEYNHKIKGDKYYYKKISYTMPRINQPTIVFKKECLDIVGFYNLNKKVAPDYDWLLRLYKKGLKGKYNENIITYFTLDGNSHIQYFKGIKEVRESSFENGGSIFWTNFYYYARYTKRYIKNLFNI
ncbi:glycosyltransferase family 2 protein [Malaciobacter mytili]|uniref:glycosyltransferase family 2 protein n=1 Tax=Malaciobacter mytili TaxID=603050 RepID=UPI003A8B7B1D